MSWERLKSATHPLKAQKEYNKLKEKAYQYHKNTRRESPWDTENVFFSNWEDFEREPLVK